jgi:hypothetical protein
MGSAVVGQHEEADKARQSVADTKILGCDMVDGYVVTMGYPLCSEKCCTTIYARSGPTHINAMSTRYQHTRISIFRFPSIYVRMEASIIDHKVRASSPRSRYSGVDGIRSPR